MVASLRETLGWTSRGRVGVAGDASADASASFRGNTKKSDDDGDARACACGTRRLLSSRFPRADTFRLRMDRLMAHRFVLPPCETFLRGREAVSLDVGGDATDDEDFQKEEPETSAPRERGARRGFASREALVGDALVCLSFHDEVAERFVAEAAADEPPRAREGGDDSGYDDSGYDEAEERRKAVEEETRRETSARPRRRRKSVPPRLPPAAHRASRRRRPSRSPSPAESPWAPAARRAAPERVAADVRVRRLPERARVRGPDGAGPARSAPLARDRRQAVRGAHEQQHVPDRLEAGPSRGQGRGAAHPARRVRGAHRRRARARGTTDRFDDLFTAHAARAAATLPTSARRRAAPAPAPAPARRLEPISPLVGAEPMQVVRYDRGEMYTAHYDNKQVRASRGDVHDVPARRRSRRRDGIFQRRARREREGGDAAHGVRVWPKRGRALVFWSVRGGVERRREPARGRAASPRGGRGSPPNGCRSRRRGPRAGARRRFSPRSTTLRA